MSEINRNANDHNRKAIFRIYFKNFWRNNVLGLQWCISSPYLFNDVNNVQMWTIIQ